MHLLNRNFGLDLVRTFAITLVLISHFFKKIDFFGFWGVELFFSLSGFLIGGILWREIVLPDKVKMKHIFNFWLRRWYRTLPNYYLFLLIMIIFHSFITNDFKYNSIVLSFFWFGQNIRNRNPNFFGVSWSLCIEEWSYLIFPFLLLVGKFIGLRKQQLLISVIIILILGSVFIRYLMIKQEINVGLRGITLARMDAIVYGILVSYLSSDVFKNIYFHKIALIFGIIGILFCIIIFKRYKPIYELYLLVVAPLSFAFILPAFTKLSISKNIYLPLKKIIENISLWSYSIYLCHIPVLISCYKVMSPFRYSLTGNIISKIVGLFLTIFLASFLYRKFEYPIIRIRPKSL